MYIYHSSLSYNLYLDAHVTPVVETKDCLELVNQSQQSGFSLFHVQYNTFDVFSAENQTVQLANCTLNAPKLILGKREVVGHVIY